MEFLLTDLYPSWESPFLSELLLSLFSQNENKSHSNFSCVIWAGWQDIHRLGAQSPQADLSSVSVLQVITTNGGRSGQRDRLDQIYKIDDTKISAGHSEDRERSTPFATPLLGDGLWWDSLNSFACEGVFLGYMPLKTGNGTEKRERGTDSVEDDASQAKTALHCGGSLSPNL